MRLFIYFFLFSMLGFCQTDFEKAEQFLDKNQYQKAQDLMSNYVRNNPNDKKAIELLGDAYGKQEKWDSAIENYKKLVELSPKTANYHYKYGGALGMKALSIPKIKALGIIGDVKDSFLKAAELDPHHIDARWALVELYMQLPGIIGGSKSKALKYADELQNLSKVDGYLAKGYIYEYDKQPNLAEKYYKLAITEGGSLNCFEKLTNFYEKQKQPEKAIANIEAAHDKHQQNKLFYELGKISAEHNVQLDKGEASLNRYLTKYSYQDGVPKAWANYRLAQIYKHRKEKNEALKYIALAIADLPKNENFKKEKMAIEDLK